MRCVVQGLAERCTTPGTAAHQPFDNLINLLAHTRPHCIALCANIRVCTSLSLPMFVGEPPEPPSQLVSLWQKLLYGRNEVALVHVLGLQRGKSPEGEEE